MKEDDGDCNEVYQEIFDSITKTISWIEWLPLDREVTIEKLCDATFSLAKGRVLGPDGITLFWDPLGPILLDLLNTGMQDGVFHVAIVRGNIILIPKKENQILLNNKRPIMLLNIVYKVFAKVYQMLLTIVLQRFISFNQNAFLLSQNIHHLVLLTCEFLLQASISNEAHLLLKLNVF